MSIVSILVGLAFQIVGYLIAPRPKQEKPPAAKDMEAPTADAGRPVPVVFGTVRVKGLNFLDWSEKLKVERNKSSGTKKK